ncbi:MAG: lipoyl(octanoyl) transferase LipB [Propionibacteriales bacterium]|nr:lipoyl(octanoyl) transferase LipB [Propionibacteriales bacterium]
MPVDFRRLDLGMRLIPYLEAWDLQKEIHAQVVSGALDDTVLLLEHAPVFTAGKRTDDHERPTGGGTPVIDVDRGGKITWHGPGQLVTYPIIKLPDPIKVVDFVRRLEEAMIRTFTAFGISTGRIGGRSGVWLAADAGGPERKIAAIGLRVASQTTMHGVALNIHPDMTDYARIVACGIADAGVTSLAAEIGAAVALTEVADVFTPHLAELLTFAPYESSPDVAEPRPEPGRVRRITL